MDKNTILENTATKIREIIGNKDLQLTEDTLIELIGLNSIAFIKMLVFLEDEYEIEFEDDDLVIEEYRTFGDIVNKIRKLSQ